MPYLELPDARLYYETAGSPQHPAVLLIHAGIATLRMWDPLVDALAEGHHVVRFDTRGFGLTESSDTVFSHRADAAALLDRLDIAAAVVVGCSRGGGIAIDLAVAHPDRVAGLVVIGGGPDGFEFPEPTGTELQMFEQIGAALKGGDPERALRLETELWAIGPRRRADQLDPGFVKTAYELNLANLPHAGEERRGESLDPPAVSGVAHLAMPALFVVGDEDLGETLDAYQWLVDTVPGAEGTVMMNTAHLPSVEQPTQFAALLLDWLERKVTTPAG